MDKHNDIITAEIINPVESFYSVGNITNFALWNLKNANKYVSRDKKFKNVIDMLFLIEAFIL